MNTKLLTLSVVGCLFSTILHLRAQGHIVPDGVTYAGLNFLGGYEVRVRQNASNSDYTGFWLIPRGMSQPTVFTNTFSFDHYLDEGVRVFMVASNQPVSLQPILANSYTEVLYPNSYVFPSGSPFYLGLYTGYNPWNSTGEYTGIYTDPLFGWARLVNNQGVIQMLDSALVYGADGIYAGTFNMIPEPSIYGLTALGVLLLIRFHRRNSSRAKKGR